MQRNKISFKGQKISIGIDVHKNSWYLAIAPEKGVVEQTEVKPTAKALFDLLHKHYPEGDYLAAYEAGFTGFSTYYALESVGIACLVVNAADIPTTQYEETMKTDRIDAKKIVTALRAGQLKGIYVHDKDDLDARAIVRLRKIIQKDIAAYKARVKHFLYTNGVSYPERFEKVATHWSNAFMLWLKEDVKLLSTKRDTLDLLIEYIETSRKTLLGVTRKIRELSQTTRYKYEYDLLTSIPGIGPTFAMTLLTEIGDFNRFKNERQFASYLGLVPSSHSSGEKIVHGPKTFRGNKAIGPLIIEASWVSIRSDHRLASAYSHYRRKKKKQDAIVRVARKLSNIILAVMKTGKRYEPYTWD